MGSHNFTDVTYTTAGLEEAYRALCDERAYEEGHGGYSGTIATTYGARAVPGVKPTTVEEAMTISTDRLDNLQKWDVCEAIPLVAETRAEYQPTGVQEVTVTVPGVVYNDQEALKKAIAKQAKVKPADIASFTVARTDSVRISAVPQVKAAATTGATETRYFILTGNDTRMPDWADGHSSQAAARQALASTLRNEWSSIPDVQAEIISMTRRASGEPLVQATVTAKTVTATFRVRTHKLVKPATRGTERAGWFFFGWAAS